MLCEISLAQRRRQVVLNRSMAELFGMHGEEVLSRFADHDFALPVSEADGIRHFLYDLSECPSFAILRKSLLDPSIPLITTVLSSKSFLGSSIHPLITIPLSPSLI